MPVKIVSAADLLDLSREGVALLDVRAPKEYRMGTVPGAINVPYSHQTESFYPPYLDKAALEELDPEAEELADLEEATLSLLAKEAIAAIPEGVSVYVFCKKGDRSALAAALLDACGFDVTDVVDGYRGYLMAEAARM